MKIKAEAGYKGTALLLVVFVGLSFVWKTQQEKTLISMKQTQQSQVRKAENLNKDLVKVRTEKKFDITHNYETQSADKVITSFFKAVRTYDDSKSYNDRKERVRKSNVTTNKILNSDMFKTDKEGTGENYIDNTGMSAQFEKATFYVAQDTQGQLKGQVLVESTLNYERASTAVYDVTYDKESVKLTDVQYVYGLLKDGKYES